MAVGAGLLLVGVLASRGHAAVVEPNGLMVPRPVSTVEVNLANNFTPPAVVALPALFQARGENVDWLKDAMTTPSVFSPLCTFTGELVVHGGACHIDFGWYNVDPARTGPPPDNQIYTLIPGNTITQPWHPSVGEPGPKFTTADIRADPHYQGGLIGFALKGDPGADCKQTHFSEQDLNVKCTNCTPVKSWAAALIWQSTETPNAYYIGFEDLAMSPTDFGGFAGQPYKNDGDFNDFVYFLSGITCDGGGTPCDTTMPGVCAAGINECVTGTQLTCRPSVKPSAEICDGLDNDCNGMVDDNAICPPSQVCDRGVCVPPCGDAEFGCPFGSTCKAGFCVETTCIDKTCAAGTVCKHGQCVGSCEGVVCPRQQACRVGRCVDPCAGVTCDSDRVCEGGVCVIACNCRGCHDGQTCDKSGRCLDSTCIGKTCAAGEACVAGTCTDACQGAVCPTGQTCKAGGCVDEPRVTGGGPAAGSGGSTAGGGGSGGAAGGLDAAAGIDARLTANGAPPPNLAPVGCSCSTGTLPGGDRWLGGTLLLLLTVIVRRGRGAGRR